MASDFNSFEEVQFAYNKLLQYGQLKWQNQILPRWEQAYRRAYGTAYTDKKTNSRAVILSIFGIIIGEVTGVELIFAPLMLGLDQWKEAKPALPLKATQNPDDFAADRKAEFGSMLEICAQDLLDLQARVKSGNDVMTRIEWETFLSTALLSPIWYPPQVPDVDFLAKRIERRIYALILTDPTNERTNTTAYWGFHDMEKLPGDTDSIDFARADELMRQWAAQRVERDAVGRIDLYNDQESDVAKGWRKEMWPLAAELSRPAPLDYPLPAFVQSYLEQAAKVSAAAQKKGGRADPHTLVVSALGAPVTRHWWRQLEWWQQRQN